MQTYTHAIQHVHMSSSLRKTSSPTHITLTVMKMHYPSPEKGQANEALSLFD